MLDEDLLHVEDRVRLLVQALADERDQSAMRASSPTSGFRRTQRKLAPTVASSRNSVKGRRTDPPPFVKGGSPDGLVRKLLSMLPLPSRVGRRVVRNVR